MPGEQTQHAHLHKVSPQTLFLLLRLLIVAEEIAELAAHLLQRLGLALRLAVNGGINVLNGPGNLLGKVDRQRTRHNAHQKRRNDEEQVVLTHGIDHAVRHRHVILQPRPVGNISNQMIFLARKRYRRIAASVVRLNERRVKVAVNQIPFLIQQHQLHAAGAQVALHRGDHVLHRNRNDRYH